jgi:preprotein translocase subunit SecF
MEWIKPGTKIDFIGKRLYFFIASMSAIALSLLSFYWPGPNWGIDFKGGTEIRVRFAQTADIGQVRAAVDSLNLGEGQIQSLKPEVGESFKENQDFLIRVQLLSEQEGNESAKTNKLISDKLAEKFGKDSFTVLEVNYVGPKVGKELRTRGIQALLYSMIGILIYVAIRFEFAYALGAVLALFHDTIISAGFYNCIQREWSLGIIAALLTIIGYSVNDTVVIFDRIRENIKKARRGTLGEIMNQSLNETLSRTILTSFATLLAVIFLAIFGSGVIRDFSIVMIFGIVIGTYSSIYIASSLVLVFEDVRNKRTAKEKMARIEKPEKSNKTKNS